MLLGLAAVARCVDDGAQGIADHDAAGIARLSDHDAAGIVGSMIHHAAGGLKPTPAMPGMDGRGVLPPTWHHRVMIGASWRDGTDHHPSIRATSQTTAGCSIRGAVHQGWVSTHPSRVVDHPPPDPHRVVIRDPPDPRRVVIRDPPDPRRVVIRVPPDPGAS